MLSCIPKTANGSETSDGSSSETAGGSSSSGLLHLFEPAGHETLHLLRWLSLQGVADVLDLTPLAACTRLLRLHLRGCPSICDLSPLARCSQVNQLLLAILLGSLDTGRCAWILQTHKG